MIKNDLWITEQSLRENMIKPFLKSQVREGVISSGVSSFGYDITLADELYIFDRDYKGLIDPKNFDKKSLIKLKVKGNKSKYVILPPFSFALGHSIEYMIIPNNVMCLCTCKSTYARVGLNLNNTTFEPGWEDIVTLELSNPTPLPIKIYINEGIAQVLFFEGNQPNVTYRDKKGKYQKQKGVTFAKI